MINFNRSFLIVLEEKGNEYFYNEYRKKERKEMEKPQINVREIIRKLPDDIVRYILPFTYSYQTPELIEDIHYLQ